MIGSGAELVGSPWGKPKVDRVMNWLRVIPVLPITLMSGWPLPFEQMLSRADGCAIRCGMTHQRPPRPALAPPSAPAVQDRSWAARAEGLNRDPPAMVAIIAAIFAAMAMLAG